MKNIQVIDGARNCAYDIFAASDEEFSLIFPESGQDIEFAEDFVARVGDDVASLVFNEIWKRPVDKKTVCGIHGTLFFELQFKRVYYPNKRDSD